MSVLLLMLLLATTTLLTPARTIAHPNIGTTPSADGTTYYVSSSSGSDTADGLSEATALQTIEKVNTLELQPGDQVLFKCGDVWRTEPLLITTSGTQESPITFGSYPSTCSDKPILTGSQPVQGWTPFSDNIYVANLNAGDNAGRFPNGINQVFKNDERLTQGRWPNLNADGSGGYAFIESASDARTIVDTELPAEDWTGAVMHVKTIRWLLLNREVTASSGNTLSVGDDINFWGGDATGWGYFLNNHLKTLDQDGEWYYDEATSNLYLYASDGTPTQIEASVVLDGDESFAGGIIIGKFKLGFHAAYVVVDNFEIKNWFAHGISFPRNLEGEENHHLTIQNVHIRNVESIGMNLATWMYKPTAGEAGWRGGYAHTITSNVIDGANHFGIHTYARSSLFHNNTVRNIGLIKNLGKSGLGCSYTGANCTENGDGIRIKVDKPDYSANGNTFQYNRLENIAYVGFDVFGSSNTFEYNVIKQACYTKGDCGGIRTFGRNNLTETPVHSIIIRNNIILDTIGNTDGDNEKYKPLFGMGLYIDNYSRDVTATGNTIINSTINGILYQRSTGTVQNNTLYNNNSGTMGRGQVGLAGDETVLADMSGNILYGLKVIDNWTFARTLTINKLEQIQSANNNYFFQPYRANHISADGNKTLEEWQAYSGLDQQSKTNWFTLQEGDDPLSEIFYNDTIQAKTIDLGTTTYVDLDQQPVAGSITLQPYTSQILIRTGEQEPATSLGVTTERVDFGTPIVGTSSQTETITLSNTGSQTVTISSIALGGSHAQDFTMQHTCGEVLNVDEQCTIAVSFAPSQSGARTATLSIVPTDGDTLTIALSGGYRKLYLALVRY